MEKSTKKLILIISCILAVLIAASAAAYAIWKDSLTPGNNGGGSSTASTSSHEELSKTVSIKIIAENREFVFTYETEAEFLREALEEKDLVKGDESEYGLFVTEVYGIKADPAKRQWWKLTKDGQDLMTGVDTTPIANGDEFCLILDTY
ncbi:MAG: DUF4430 domain-containing protein [Clostridia bacterium]|nr:DUF4430 domain-containing protein [Clostridia bacterium]